MGDEGRGLVIGRELVTTDEERAARFYCDLFGWTIDDEAMAAHGFSCLLRDGDGRLVGSVMPLGEASAPQWLPWFGISDVDAAVAIVLARGGRVLDGPADAPGIGRYAWVLDPGGAHVGLLESVHGSAAVLSTQAMFDELISADPDAARDFYGALFGWQHVSMPIPNGSTYTLFFPAGVEPGGRPAAGMLPLMPGMTASLWMVYFAVESLADALDRVPALGGSAHSPVIPVPNVGRLVWVADPTGAMIQLIEPEPMPGA
jgi:predicted enzyme related to lactoylglutathione lyase